MTSAGLPWPRSCPIPTLASPNAERKDGGAGAVRRELPFLAIALGFLVVAVVVVIILRLVIGSSADNVAESIQQVIGK